MGNRGSFAVRKEGRTRIYNSSFGGLYAVRSLFYGQEKALASYDYDWMEEDWLYLDTFCEGGALLDLDARSLVFFQSHMPYHSELRQLLLSLMRTTWPGWTLHWARGGIVEIAGLIGFDPAEVRCIEDGDVYEEAPRWDVPADWVGSILTLEDSGGVKDYCVESGVLNILTLGPDAIHLLEKWGPSSWTLADLDEMDSGANIDLERRIISVWFLGTMDEERVERLRRHWPGWTIERHDDGLPGQLERSGRDHSLGRFGEKEIIRQLVSLLFEDDEIGPDLILEHLGLDGRPARNLSPELLQSRGPRGDLQERVAILGKALSTLRGTGGL